MSTRHHKLLLGIGAACIVVTSAIAALRWSAQPEPSQAAAMPAQATARAKEASLPSSPDHSLSPQDSAHMHELLQIIGEKPELTEDDAGRIIEIYIQSDELAVQRAALVVAGNRLHYAKKMPESSRRDLEQFIINAFGSPNWRIRRCAVASIDGSPFAARNEVQAWFAKLANDPQPEVAARVRLILDRVDAP
jgi:hypothetical protein